LTFLFDRCNRGPGRRCSGVTRERLDSNGQSTANGPGLPRRTANPLLYTYILPIQYTVTGGAVDVILHDAVQTKHPVLYFSVVVQSPPTGVHQRSTGQAPTARRRRETRAHTVTRSHIDEPHNHPETIQPTNAPTQPRDDRIRGRPGGAGTPRPLALHVPVKRHRTGMGLDGCEVRLCGPCAFVRPRGPCVPGSPRCLFTVCLST